jgi:hypothetical protein
MRNRKSFTTDEKQQTRLEQIQAELGQDMLEKLQKAFFVLAEAMMRRAVRKAEAELLEGQMTTTQTPVDAVPEEDTMETDVDGHTANRTNMLPWESCGPDCPVCTESET